LRGKPVHFETDLLFALRDTRKDDGWGARLFSLTKGFSGVTWRCPAPGFD
jgi:hypothetical protein